MKKNKKLVIAIICIVVIIALIAGLFGIYFSLLSRVPEREDIENRSSRFFSRSKSYVVAEYPYGIDSVFETRLGLESFYREHRHNASVIEMKIQVTKDGKAVVFSDSLSTYSNAHILYNGAESISDLTLEELKKINLAYNYADENGQMFYKTYDDDGNIDLVNILTVEEFIAWFNSQRSDLPLFAVSFYDESNISDANSVVDEVNRVFTDIGFADFFFFYTNSADTAKYIDESYPDMIRSATSKETKKLFRDCLSNKDVSVSYEVVYTVSDTGLLGKFSSEKFINYTNNSNIALILRDVEKEAIESLVSLGVDGISSSDPAACYQIIKNVYHSSKTTTE